MFKKSVSVLLCIMLVITMGLSLCACDGSDSDEYPVTINNVTIEEEPENIVVLSSKHADIISYIGYDVKMVGKSTECDHEYFKRVPDVGTDANPDIEAIISLETDLVITETALSKDAQKKLNDANIKVLTLETAKNFSEMKKMYETLGTALGGNVTGKDKGIKAHTELLDTLKDFEDLAPNDIISSACYLYVDENGKLCTFTKGSLEFDVFSYCGAKNTFVTQETPEIDLEQLKIGTPSYIFYDNVAVLDLISTNSELASMSAVKNGNMMEIPKSEFSYLGITFYDTIYQMMDFMFFEDEATPDEATPEQATTAPTTDKSEPSEVKLSEDSYTIE